MQLQNFTTELLYSIFQNLSNADQITCSLVCQSWRTVVAPLCYENITFSDQYYHQITASISEKKDWLCGRYVQNLIISMNLGPPSRETFSNMLSQLPYLKKVTVSSLHFCIYMDYLKGMNQRIQLEEIVNKYQRHQIDYLACVYQYRQSIKRLNITFCDTTFQLGTPSVLLNNPLQYLKDFTKLRYLTVNKQGGISRNTFSLLNLLQHCPNLVGLTFRDFAPESAIDDNLSLKTHHRFLKQVSLTLYQLNLSHIKYILSYFPACLDFFSLTLTCTDSSTWRIEGRDKKTAMQSLGDYLGQSAKEVEVFIWDMFFTETNREHPLSSYDTVAAYVSFVRSIQGNRNLLYRLSMSVASSAPQERQIEIKRDERTMRFIYALELRYLIKHIEEDPFSFLSSNSRQKLKSARLMIEEDDNSNTSLGKIARCLLSTYSSLSFVMLTIYNSLIQEGGSVSFVSMENDCKPSFSRDIINGAETIAGPLCRGQDYLHFDNVILSTDGLKEITDLFTSIKLLKLLPCRIIDNTPREVTLDFSKIKHSEMLILNLDKRLYDWVHLHGFNLQLENVNTKKTILYYAEILDNQRYTLKQVKALMANYPKQLYSGSTKIPIITIRYQKMEILSIGVDQGPPIFHVPL